MAVRTHRNPIIMLIEFVAAYFIAAVPVSLVNAWIAGFVFDASYQRRFDLFFALFGIIWLTKAGIDTLEEFRDEQAA